VADYLRTEILEGRLRPGTRLFQDVEAAKLQVSRTPVREAFQQLDAERLVEMTPNRGAIVTRPSLDAIREIYLIRSQLESMAAAEAAKRATTDDIGKVGTFLEEVERVVSSNDGIALLAANKRFHFRVYECARLPRLTEIISSLWEPIEAVRAAYVSAPTGAKHATADHGLLYEALQNHDACAAAEVTRRHIKGTADSLIRRVEKIWESERGEPSDERVTASS
jgi:DNA-binding GntR family transcriptional regulator